MALLHIQKNCELLLVSMPYYFLSTFLSGNVSALDRLELSLGLSVVRIIATEICFRPSQAMMLEDRPRRCSVQSRVSDWPPSLKAKCPKK
jgi:hypothetical protein